MAVKTHDRDELVVSGTPTPNRVVHYGQLVLDEGVGVAVAREPAVPDGPAPGDQ